LFVVFCCKIMGEEKATHKIKAKIWQNRSYFNLY